MERMWVDGVAGRGSPKPPCHGQAGTGERVGMDLAPSQQWVPMARPYMMGAAEMAPCPVPAGAVGSQPLGPGLPCAGGTGAAQHLWVLSISTCPGCCRVPGVPAWPDPAVPWAIARSPLPGQRQRGGSGQPPGGEHSPPAGPQGWHRALVCLRGAARSCPWCETGGNKEHCLEALLLPSFLPCWGARLCLGWPRDASGGITSLRPNYPTKPLGASPHTPAGGRTAPSRAALPAGRGSTSSPISQPRSVVGHTAGLVGLQPRACQ